MRWETVMTHASNGVGRTKVWSLLLGGLVALGFRAAAPGATAPQGAILRLYVATDGNDQWSGRLDAPNSRRSDGPLATLERARDAIRQLKRDGRLHGPVEVLVRGGMYFLKAPFVLTPADSGTAEAPITYGAYGDENPILSGGRPIHGWKKGSGPLWTVELPEVKAGRWYFRQLFINGRRATRARQPNQGYLRVAGLVDAKPGARWNEGVDRFRFAPGDIHPWRDLSNTEVVVFHSWNTSRVRIAEVNEREAIVRFTGRTIFRPLAWDPEQRYYVENARELLDAPGEWYLDRQTGVLTYWPLEGEDMTTAECIAPVLTELVRFQGDPDRSRFVEYVRLVGLSFQHADWTLGPQGYGDPQAAVTIPAAVMADGVCHGLIRRCEIAHVGRYGLWLRRGCKHNRIEQNHIHDLGAGGVRLGEAHMAKTDVAESSDNRIANNYIHDGGHVYAAGVGFWLAHASHNVFEHNEIHSFDYSGISLGWNWGEQPTRTLHNTIQFNHVHHVMRGVLSDGAGIYTLGTQTGTAIRNNLFHDVWPYMGRPAMAWGIYFDQGSNGLTVENNVVYHTLTGGLMGTGKPSITVRNNVFALSAWQAAWRYAWTHEPAGIVEKNIFYLTQGELFHPGHGRDDTKTVWDSNLYWRTDGRPLEFYDEPFAAWQARGMDRHGLVADPRFVDPVRFDFRLRPDSPAFELGIQSIDTSRCGIVEPPELAALARQASFAPTRLPPVPPPPAPVPIDDDFETTPPGSPPAHAVVVVENRGDAIVVTDEGAAAGKRSLKITDAAGLEHAFNPHLFYRPHFRDGRAVLRFAARVERGAVLAHEWRDARRPYRVGPQMRVDGQGNLYASGRKLLRVPPGTWFRVQIECGLGKTADGTYDMTVHLPGAPSQRFHKLRSVTPAFDQLEWLGFISLANGSSVIYLDELNLQLRQ